MYKTDPLVSFLIRLQLVFNTKVIHFFFNITLDNEKSFVTQL